VRGPTAERLFTLTDVRDSDHVASSGTKPKAISYGTTLAASILCSPLPSNILLIFGSSI
jgi:hypothetical protein